MKKIRDLKVRIGDGVIVPAVYLMDDDGVIWYQEDGGEIEPYVGHKYGCSECRHWVFNAKTENDIYYVKPLPPHTSKCGLMDDPRYDITFRSAWNSNHPACDHFELAAQNYSEDNVNQFIDIKNSCIHSDAVHIQGYSYEGRQAPFDFYVSGEEWRNLSFIDGARVRMIKPVMWHTYKTPSGIKRGYDNYIEAYKDRIPKSCYGEIKEAFGLNCIRCQQKFSGLVFDFERMWFI